MITRHEEMDTKMKSIVMKMRITTMGMMTIAMKTIIGIRSTTVTVIIGMVMMMMIPL